MKFGLLTAILEGTTFEEAVDLQQRISWNVLKLPAGQIQVGLRDAMLVYVILMRKH